MKNIYYNRMIRTLRILCIGTLMFCVHVIAFASPEQFDIPQNPTDFSNMVEVLYGALVILLGYASELPHFTFLKKWKRVYKVLAVALLTGGVVYWAGLSTAVELLVSYTGATSFYELFLKPFFATKQVREFSKKEKLENLKSK